MVRIFDDNLVTITQGIAESPRNGDGVSDAPPTNEGVPLWAGVQRHAITNLTAYNLGRVIGAWTRFRIGLETVIGIEHPPANFTEALAYEQFIHGMQDSGIRALSFASCPAPLLWFFADRLGIDLAIMLTAQAPQVAPDEAPAQLANEIQGMMLYSAKFEIPRSVFAIWERMYTSRNELPKPLDGFMMHGNGYDAYLGSLLHYYDWPARITPPNIIWQFPSSVTRAVARTINHLLDMPAPDKQASVESELGNIRGIASRIDTTHPAHQTTIISRITGAGAIAELQIPPAPKHHAAAAAGARTLTHAQAILAIHTSHVQFGIIISSTKDTLIISRADRDGYAVTLAFARVIERMRELPQFAHATAAEITHALMPD